MKLSGIAGTYSEPQLIIESTIMTEMSEQEQGYAPLISVVIPIFNEEEVLPSLFPRLYEALDALDRSYQVIFVD